MDLYYRLLRVLDGKSEILFIEIEDKLVVEVDTQIFDF